MSIRFKPTQPFTDADFPTIDKKKFPIIEVFGYDRALSTEEARGAFDQRHCPYSGKACEKFHQYGYGYCSVQYKSKYDKKEEVYAVCDHRLDGVPVRHALLDYYGTDIGKIQLIEELKFTNPDQSFDFIAIDPATDNFVAIETQAIDLRGGGVGPVWESIIEGNPAKWREYFTAEAEEKERKDNVAYGVNMANITKRLGVQVAEKGSLMRQLKAKLYVVAQNLCFQYFCSRVPAEWIEDREGDWDITFITFDYTGNILQDGKREIAYVQTKRTTLASFAAALTRATATLTRADFLKRIRDKLKLPVLPVVPPTGVAVAADFKKRGS